MRLVKLGIVNVDATVGAVRSNVDRCISLARRAADEGVGLAVFPEQVVGGYAAEDLVQWHAFVEKQRGELERFAYETRDLPTILALGVTTGVGGDLFNCAAVVHAGQIVALVPKEKLPTYNVFYEARTFSRGVPGLLLDAGGVPLGDFVFKADFGTFAVEVCEDVWSPDGPMRRRCYSGAEIVCNLSASPYRTGVVSTRREMLATRAADNQTTIVYANLVGANDGLIFDGGGYVNQNGRPMLEASRFKEGLSTVVVDLDRTSRCRREASTWRSDLEQFRATTDEVSALEINGKTADRAGLAYPAPPMGTSFFLPSREAPKASARQELLDDLFDALALGVADYYRKIGAFTSIGVALSGGRDSLLTVLIAWRAISILVPGLVGDALSAEVAKRLHTFYMPTRFSSSATQAAAEQIAKDLGATFLVLPIEDAFEREEAAAREMLRGAEVTEITRQNIQARIRGQRMWNWSNTSNALFLQTGNMSEKSLGYTTVGGDLEGALSVISNLPKTVVIALLERLDERFGFAGIKATLATTAGPELAADQSGEAELMPFEILDACLYLFGAEKLSTEEVARALPSLFPDVPVERLRQNADKFARLFVRSIYKWVQAPISLHVGSLDLDRERALQLPVVQKTEW
ncbi:MAG: NAD(+) synthase [Polyangiaceae bacterium]|jgi:NAD+ synthase (glutamine-hydrolysing)|nr:NAD(+) synthase [Polyangiaceae bacterium]